MPARPELTPVTPYCSIERTLVLLQDRWTFLILRDVLMYRRSRFSDLREALGIASNILTDRLDRLVDGGLLVRGEYRGAGTRPRPDYHPTEAALDLKRVLAALQQWGDVHEPRADGPTVERVAVDGGAPVSVVFADADGRVLADDEVEFRITGAHPLALRRAAAARTEAGEAARE